MPTKSIRLSKILYEGYPFHLMHLSKTLLDGTAHHVRADSTSDHRSKHAEMVFGGFVRVTGTEIGDEYRRDIYFFFELSLLLVT